jgi:predicted nucleic acid-binding protein
VVGRQTSGPNVVDAAGGHANRVECRPRGSRVTLYLDTSSLVKLYVDETGGDEVRELLASATVVATSCLAYTEARAALARRRRERVLTAREFTAAKKAFETDWPRYLAVDVTPALCRDAGELAERYRLRAYDSIHLAAFAEVARAAGVRTTWFSSFDQPLGRAATSLIRALRRSR